MNKYIVPIILFTASFSKAQTIENNSKLELREIMKGDKFIGHQPSNIRWDQKGENILFYWNPENNPGDSEYAYNLKSGENSKIKSEFYDENQTYSESEYFSEDGKLMCYSKKTGSKKELISFHTKVSNVQEFEEIVYFQINSGFYKYYKSTGAISQIVEFIKGNKKTTTNEDITLMESEELSLFQFHRDQEEKNQWSKKESTPQKGSKTIYYPKGSVSNIQGTSDGQFILFRTNEYPELPKTHVEHHISSDGHSYTKNARSKVSDQDPNHKFGVYNLENDSVYYIDFSSLKNIKKKPAYLSEYGIKGEYDDNRNIIMHEIQFSENGMHNAMDIRSYDNKDRWIVSIDFENGQVTTLEHQHDEAWIGGPGISNWNMVQGTLGWLKDNETIYFQSEETGYSHLYTLNTSSKKKTQLSSGKWEVHQAQLNSNGTKFFIHANKIHPGNRGFYHLNLSNNELIPILENDGNYEVSVSPDEKSLAVRYSYKNKPWELYICPNKANTKLNQITNSTSTEFNQYEWFAPEVTTFKATDGHDIYARVYSPDAKKNNGAAIIFVHGAGYLQNAHNFWSGYYREYMFHNLLRDNGFTVLDIDYRASKGYGRDHRTGIYRHMGGLDLSDHIDGKKFLVDSLGVDSERVGIYGGSYGGFITLMALLTEPGEFKAGAAIRSVTDWAHYNHEYTSNILNYPGLDPKAYKKSSPIYFAENLEDKLLMLHGMVDDNVQFQDVVRLSQRFIELEKTDWELAVFPVEAHGFKKSSSWNDEYRRIYKLFYQELILNK
ncbi:MAG: alpha/beta fold hydrolase [Crocinitomicaceae bacterium]|nr:alpha/beta fold hydrolase [Crocinitomicaceae bacterium]